MEDGGMKRICLFFVCGLILPIAAQAAGFDCGKAKTKVEKLICSNATVSKLDREMQSVYQDAYKRTADPAGLKLEQRQWLKTRNACKDVTCLIRAYRTRTAELKAILAEPKPCFRLLERKWPEVASGHYPVCVDFLKNLNSFCEEAPITKWIKIDPGDKIMLPVNLTSRPSCEWKINPAINTLRIPHWEAIDPKAHLKIIQNMQQHDYRDPEEKWQPIQPDMLQRIYEGQSRLWHTWIDIDRDEQKEHVVRFDDLPCNRGEQTNFFGLPTRLAVVDDNISKVDTHYEYLHYGFDIVIHDDKTYIMTRLAIGGVQVRFKSGLVGFRDHLDLREPFSVPETGSKGMSSVCVFDYIK
jgi:uncharacterized protein